MTTLRKIGHGPTFRREFFRKGNIPAFNPFNLHLHGEEKKSVTALSTFSDFSRSRTIKGTGGDFPLYAREIPFLSRKKHCKSSRTPPVGYSLSIVKISRLYESDAFSPPPPEEIPFLDRIVIMARGKGAIAPTLRICKPLAFAL